MRILYVNWKCFGAEDATEALKKLGHEVALIQLSDKAEVKLDREYADKLQDNIKKNGYDLVFSFNYYPTISEACMQAGCKYMAWIYDNPYIKVYDKSVTNSCNYVFTFDSMMLQELQKQGVSNVYYAPMAVNVERLDGVIGRNTGKEYISEIAFVGSLYNEKHNFFERLARGSRDEYLIGYLQAVMEAQMQIQGYNFMAECLTDSIVERIEKVMPYDMTGTEYTTLSHVYADYFLCRQLAYMERSTILELLSARHQLHLYTKNEEAAVGNAVNKGMTDYFTEMPRVFHNAKINLNISLRSIKNGIPLRAMDIMGAGGFLLTNFQQDFLQHFEPDTDFVYYESPEDCIVKADYYLQHDEIRETIARNGYEKVKKYHTYEHQLREMLDTVMKN